MNERQAILRKKRRWWLAPPLLALLIAGGMIYSRINLGPELQPAASYKLPAIYSGSPLLFSASEMGYPAVSASLMNVGGLTRKRYRVLDDLCRPGDKIVTDYNINISPTREIVSWVGNSNFIFRRRDGRLASVPCPTKGVNSPGPWPSSDGTIGYLDYDKIHRAWLYAPDGSILPSPSLAGGWIIPLGIASGDNRLIPITDRIKIFLYNITANKILVAMPYPKRQKTMIWRHKNRLLLAPHAGDALVFEGAKQTATIAPGADGWRWGEDGSVWTLSGGRLRVLRWRAGRPALVNISTRGKPGARYGSLAPGLNAEPPFYENTMPDWAAVWGDGKMVASVENITINNFVTSIAAHAAKSLHMKIKINEARRLTLYSDNRRLGYFRLLTASDPTARSGSGRGHGGVVSMRYENTGNHEHLAFTADGKYLSWAIDDGTGVRLFVFEVPRVE